MFAVTSQRSQRGLSARFRFALQLAIALAGRASSRSAMLSSRGLEGLELSTATNQSNDIETR
jgi:hypothetical protein